MIPGSPEYQRQRRQEKRSKGICLTCSQPAVPNRARCKKCSDKDAKKSLGINVQAKIEVLTHYGNNKELQCCWPNCTITDIDMLTLDHINNNGAEERRKVRRTGVMLYRHIRTLDFPKDFQTLCFNHQWKKEILRCRELRH